MRAKMILDGLTMKGIKLKDCDYLAKWLQGFKERHDIQICVFHGEGAWALLTEVVEDQIAALNVVIFYCKACDKFNMDKTSLFWKMQPTCTNVEDK